jgi:hypothetical protein
VIDTNQLNVFIGRQANGLTQTDRQTDRETDRWMDKWMDGWMNGRQADRYV